MMRRMSLFPLISVLAYTTALATTGGRDSNVPATRIYTYATTLLPNVGYTIRTFGLSTGADTVLHVQSYPSGLYLAGNDDVSGLDLSSSVYISSSSSSRQVWIVVRAYSAGSGGAATLGIKPDGQSESIQAFYFESGYERDLSATGAPYQTEFMGVEQQGGTPDAVILVTSDDPAHAIAFDDDDGIDTMPWVRLTQANGQVCTGAFCRVYIGRRTQTTGAPDQITLV